MTDQKLVADYLKLNKLAAITAAPPLVAAAIKRLQEKEQKEIRERQKKNK